MVGDAVEQRGGHLGIAENADPFAELQVGGNDQRGLFVELADQVKQQCATRVGKRQIAQLIQNYGIDMQQLLGQVAGFALLLFALQLVDQIDGVVETQAFALVDGGDAQGGGQVGFACARAADQDQVVRAVHKGGAGQLLDLPLIEGRFGPVDGAQVTMDWKAGSLELIAQAAHLPIGLFGLD